MILFSRRPSPQTSSHLADLLEIDPSIGLGSQPPLVDPWGMPISAPTTMAPSIPHSSVSDQFSTAVLETRWTAF